ncbi:DUF1788 domain-containing protein [Persicobacter sp. CCB-QB2]|uniref:DUF1788 domain-containing protein n=1 Tax=Persicobacter sp. CCB-QB2 TaxID=1561025 RepID=UPI0006A9BD70|nr:DUF1788 domain-containing protein [Persicobacter sp. CCB-QB2]
MYNTSEQFQHLFRVASSEQFLKMNALGGEIPFFIAPYDPKMQVEVEKAIKGLINKLASNNIEVLEINLYALSCEIIEGGMGMEKMIKAETRRNKDKFLRALQSSLNIQEVLMPAIDKKIKESNAKIYFITGIGAVFPFIRSHTVLNNLQNIAKNAPTVMFFPGNYSGTSLELFGLLKDDNYYRAFNLDRYQL